MSNETNGIWTDRDGSRRNIYGEAGEIWTSAAASRNDPSIARYEPYGWDETGDNETEWCVIEDGRNAGTITFPESAS